MTTTLFLAAFLFCFVGAGTAAFGAFIREPRMFDRGAMIGGLGLIFALAGIAYGALS
jgi:hypothetical protein